MAQITDRLATALADRYKIERHLGEGGMAAVYLAEDLRHKRKVALKLLKPDLAAVLGAERFIQEITTTASLQHPHILPLFDSGEADGFLFYVMPYVEGETLRDKLDREGQVSVDEAVRITVELADALDYAHRQNVIHRDIKPENILLHDGRPTLADFGIALAVSAAAGGRMTETGMSLGTPHYMSPEQATADKDLTGRSDIYSLGSVLYEMLTGEPPHVGGSAQAVIMKIVTDEARPVTELRKTVPPHVAAATARSLEKVPADRFETAAKFAEALTNPAYAPSAVVPSAAVAGATSDWKGHMAMPLAGLSAVLLLFIGWGWLGTAPAEDGPVIRYVIGFGDDDTPQPSYGPTIALSPDGTLLAYAGASERGSQLWVHRRDAFAPESIPGTDGIWQPVFSPDGQRVAFITGARELKIVSLTGEPPLTLADSGMWRNGLSWGYDGYVYAGFQHLPTVVGRIPVDGGAPEQVTTLDTLRGEVSHSWFDALPNGKGVLFTAMRLTNQASENDAIAVVDLETGEHHDLVQGILGRYVDGFLIYVRFDNALVAAPFDQDKLELTGPSVPLVAGMPVISGPDVALSASGRLAYAPTGSAPALAEVVWIDRQGVVTPYEPGWTINPNLGSGPEISPDGTKLAVGIVTSGVGDVYIKDVAGGPFTRLTFDGNSIRPVWAPDGQSVGYRSVSPGLSYDMFRQRADGSGPPEVLVDLEENVIGAQWSSDGEWLLIEVETPPDVYAIRAGDSTVIRLLTDDANESAPTLSPDGRWLAYVSDESGRPEIYVRSFPNVTDSKQQVSVDGGVEPRWAHSGRELFYKSRSREFVAVSVTTGDRFAVLGRETLFIVDASVGLTPGYPVYDVAPDDQRFITYQSAGLGAGAIDVIVVENFLSEVKAKMGN